jgi:hypothetical protein
MKDDATQELPVNVTEVTQRTIWLAVFGVTGVANHTSRRHVDRIVIQITSA